EPSTGSRDLSQPPVTSSGLPNSAHTVLRAGRPVTATIAVPNTGNIAKDFFADARLNKRAQLPLLGSDVNNVSLPLSLSAQPNWLIPPGTNSLIVAAQGAAPITMGASWAFGDPDFLGGSFVDASGANLRAPTIPPG